MFKRKRMGRYASEGGIHLSGVWTRPNGEYLVQGYAKGIGTQDLGSFTTLKEAREVAKRWVS